MSRQNGLNLKNKRRTLKAALTALFHGTPDECHASIWSQTIDGPDTRRNIMKAADLREIAMIVQAP